MAHEESDGTYLKNVGFTTRHKLTYKGTRMVKMNVFVNQAMDQQKSGVTGKVNEISTPMNMNLFFFFLKIFIKGKVEV